MKIRCWKFPWANPGLAVSAFPVLTFLNAPGGAKQIICHNALEYKALWLLRFPDTGTLRTGCKSRLQANRAGHVALAAPIHRGGR